MNIKTITTVDGVNAVDFGSGANRYYWFKNLGTTTVHVSGNADISADADGVAELAAGDSVCIETLGGKVYVLGAGKVVIHNTGDKFPPFRNAPVTGGGVDGYSKSESDARYAQKSDIPTSLPANGGNADTADGVSGMIILNAENIGTAEFDGAVKRVCKVNTTPKTAGYVTAGIWFKNNSAAAVTVSAVMHATDKTVKIQMGYGIGSFPSQFNNGSGRTWFENHAGDTSATLLKMAVPAGNVGYFGFNNTNETVNAIIDDITVFTDRFI